MGICRWALLGSPSAPLWQPLGRHIWDSEWVVSLPHKLRSLLGQWGVHLPGALPSRHPGPMERFPYAARLRGTQVTLGSSRTAILVALGGLPSLFAR